MLRILFICHGNICRSPMAEFVMKDLVLKAGLEKDCCIESAATSTEEVWNGHGSPVYPPAKEMLARHGIGVRGNELGVGAKRARQTVRSDYANFDLIVGMDRANLRNMHRIYGGDPEGKLHLLMEFTDRPGDVADPWYTGDFGATWRDVDEGCRALLAYCRKMSR